MSGRRRSRETVSINTGPLRAARLSRLRCGLRPDGGVPALPSFSCCVRRYWCLLTRVRRRESRSKSKKERLEGRLQNGLRPAHRRLDDPRKLRDLFDHVKIGQISRSRGRKNVVLCLRPHHHGRDVLRRRAGTFRPRCKSPTMSWLRRRGKSGRKLFESEIRF